MENVLRDSHLACVGKLLAGFTHELKNHLAIINESSGLMADMLEMGKGGEEETCRKFQKITSTIAERVVQANVLARHLNGFAHRMDVPDSVFDINELLDEELALILRFAKLKGVSISSRFQGGLPSVDSNPALLQFILFALIDSIISRLECAGEINVITLESGGNVQVRIEVAGATPEDGGRIFHKDLAELIRFAVKKINISFDGPVDKGRVSFTLNIPSAGSPGAPC